MSEEPRQRIPPGQYVTGRLPILHVGPIPPFDREKWDFKIWGLVERPVKLTYDELRALPVKHVVADIHCVTGWSKLDTRWEGISPQEILRLARVKPEAAYVLVHCEGGYTTNLPLEALLNDSVVLAYGYEGEELPPEYGGPLRLVVPKRYFYKSGKWVRGLELLAEDRPGFWEQRGYHNDADPWKEERYAG
jgi:DMSO/TMAO reductase YedYZ molybdopterin-dependent catalytic subunit